MRALRLPHALSVAQVAALWASIRLLSILLAAGRRACVPIFASQSAETVAETGSCRFSDQNPGFSFSNFHFRGIFEAIRRENCLDRFCFGGAQLG